MVVVVEVVLAVLVVDVLLVVVEVVGFVEVDVLVVVIEDINVEVLFVELVVAGITTQVEDMDAAMLSHKAAVGLVTLSHADCDVAFHIGTVEQPVITVGF